jgi:hypothetical protein
MAICEVCGNDYDKSFELIAAGTRHTFDSFECAIQAIAPTCEHCKCRSDMGSKLAAVSSAVRTVHGRKPHPMSKTAQLEHRLVFA